MCYLVFFFFLFVGLLVFGLDNGLAGAVVFIFVNLRCCSVLHRGSGGLKFERWEVHRTSMYSTYPHAVGLRLFLYSVL
jgi:hypothetical protein